MSFQTTIVANGELLQYIAFFGALVAFGGLAGHAPARGQPARKRRWPVNAGLTVLSIVALSALPVTALGAATWATSQGVGLMNQLDWPQGDWPWWVVLALGFAGRSLVSYGVHAAMHKVPMLWRVHRVHHLDTAMDITTTVRVHPLEFVIQVVPAVAAIVLLGIPAWVIMAYEIVDAFTAVATHSNLRLPARLERAIRWVLVTPDIHRIHHSARQAETDSNYGALFTVWDRLFRTFVGQPRGGHAGMTLGLEHWREDRRAQGFGWLLISPFVRAPEGPAPAQAVETV
ncbi:MAG TPA: sterol desaturase family protein [Alphaproteobacteria bacterium]|nr:sterol desaturase family protein [Alphaproteobacteria bacterium]